MKLKKLKCSLSESQRDSEKQIRRTSQDRDSLRSPILLEASISRSKYQGIVQLCLPHTLLNFAAEACSAKNIQDELKVGVTFDSHLPQPKIAVT